MKQALIAIAEAQNKKVAKQGNKPVNKKKS